MGDGAVNIATGARDTVVELGRTAADLYTIGGTNRGQFDPVRALLFVRDPLTAIWFTDDSQIDPSLLNSRLFQGAAQTAGNPQAAASFDNQLVFAITTLGVGPLVQSGYTAVESGDSTEFSQQAGGFGVMVLVPYAGGRGFAYIRGPGIVEIPPGTVRAGALAAVEGEFNPRVRVVQYVEGAAPADANLAVVNQRLQLARQILAEEVRRLEAIDPTVITPEEAIRLDNLRNASCAEAAVRLERAIATGEVNPLDPAGMLRQLSARDLMNILDTEAPITLPGTPADLAPGLANIEALQTPGARALIVIERADGTPGHVLNAENINGTIWLYETYSAQGTPIAGLPQGVVAIEAFYPLEVIARNGGYSVIVVGR